MRAALFAFSRGGCVTARRVMAALPEAAFVCYTMERFQEPEFLPLDKAVYGASFSSMDALIFVGACGIAVREIAPYVKSKKTDPAVVCIDEAGRFVIPLLSGHIGGANALAVELAEKLGATAVVTTATDVRGKFSVDAWAARHGCAISDMGLAKVVSAAILEEDIPLCSQFPHNILLDNILLRRNNYNLWLENIQTVFLPNLSRPICKWYMKHLSNY